MEPGAGSGGSGARSGSGAAVVRPVLGGARRGARGRRRRGAVRPVDPAGRLRRENLSRYLDHVGTGADTLLVAEAPGWRGMTNTGIPFTSMRELGSLGFDTLEPPEPTAPWEASSRVVHAALQDWSGPLPVAWAIFPHHPFVASDRLTNRTRGRRRSARGRPSRSRCSRRCGGPGPRMAARPDATAPPGGRCGSWPSGGRRRGRSRSRASTPSRCATRRRAARHSSRSRSGRCSAGRARRRPLAPPARREFTRSATLHGRASP